MEGNINHTDMNDNVILEPKEIGKIKGTFYVSSYQRGYRWTESQVKTLLNDLWDNCKQEVQKDYCLQPVVVRKCNEDEYELIDGQQRFTTILLLLGYISDKIHVGQPNYKLEYETRIGTSQFLNDITEKRAHENIDFYHIYNAYMCIDKWGKDNFGEDDNNMDKITNLFKLMGYLTQKVKIIWYEVGENEDPIALFTRLNIGRIQLTNAELVKALLLKEHDDHEIDRDKIERSIQWDSIEKELRSDNDELWYFLTKEDHEKYPTRIELLFDMMAGKMPEEREKYFTFFWFENEIKQYGVKCVWDEIQRNFLQIKEWYTADLFYHKIGYLISSGSKTMMELFNAAKDKRKSELLKDIDKMIADSIDLNPKEGETYSDLSYEKNYNKISNILLLFNIESIIKEDVYQRFPFSKYNTCEWSLEHIHAQNSEGLKKKETQMEWIKMHIGSVLAQSENGKYGDVVDQMQNIIDTGIIEARGTFDDLFAKVCNILSNDTDTEYIHSISNMALLAKDDNAALNNSTFDVKRNQIVEMDRKGAFIPYCTKMVFLKYYTPSNENQIHFWGKSDRDAYVKAIEEMLQPYLEINNKTF